MATGFDGKVAIITGGSSGIGRAAALAFAAEGARVAIAARRSAEGEETASLIKAAGGEAMFIATDVSQPAEVERLVQAAVERWQRLDFAFNNAGIEGPMGAFTAEYPVDQWDEVMAVNLKGVFLSMKFEIPAILKQGEGAIVNMSSVAGLVGSRGAAAYFASKHGVVGLTKAAAMEYAKSGIRINAVCPGVVETPMAERFFRGREQVLPDIHPIGRVGKPEEIADAVIWLCSPRASFITGHALPVDGGFVAR